MFRARFALRPHRVHRLPAQNTPITSQSTQIHSQNTLIHSANPPPRPRRAHRRPPTLPRIRRTIKLEHPQANNSRNDTHTTGPSSPAPQVPATQLGCRAAGSIAHFFWCCGIGGEQVFNLNPSKTKATAPKKMPDRPYRPAGRSPPASDGHTTTPGPDPA